MTGTTLDITPSPRLLQVLGEIPLQPWQCLAELIDNSLDELLRQPERTVDHPLRVDVVIGENDRGDATVTVSDNGMGMDASELERSLRAGHSGKSRYGSLGLFGMGFNIATARLGNVTTVSTTKAGSGERLRATIDFADIQRRESFTVPVETTTCEAEETGTTVEVVLKREMAEILRRSSTHRTLRSQLGDVYSFLLRDGVPGLSQSEMSSKVPAVLVLNGEEVAAKLPCVWADNRSVTSYGRDVSAIHYIDRRLTAATACMDCGYWDRKNGPEECEECGSTSLEVRERRIWGWIGIQRFIDSTNYGVDFLRYGRKILKSDKSIFTFTDPDTLQTDAEYPIEMPANQGRIVGEMHLDHVPVTYQKNDFYRQSIDWQRAVETIRGTGPIKPRGASQVNDSPLARLYSAYRRNDPGLRYLTPGDGKQALHAKAREWGANFDKGVERFREDAEWYEAARRHQEFRDGVSGEQKKDDGKRQSAGERLIGSQTPDPEPKPQPQSKPTQHETLEAARMLGTHRDDLSGSFKLGQSLGTWEISVIATRDDLSDDAGRSVAARTGVMRGSSFEVFVAGEHPIFKEYGRDLRDVALIHAASVIRDLKNRELPVSAVYAELVREVDDLKVTVPSILERIDRSLARIVNHCEPIVRADPSVYWSVLDSVDKARVEEVAAVELPMASLDEIVTDGRFIACCDASILSKVIAERPLDLFDGKVFKPSIVHRQEAARRRMVETVTRALDSLAAFQQDDLMRQKHDIQLVQINLDLLDEQTVDDELLA